MVDYLLCLLRAEREYVQLHRGTTIQSLTVLSKVEFGNYIRRPPLVRAARMGRVLVLDEADKAPLEVVCLLKGLVGDGEIQLADGHRLLSQKRLQYEYASYLHQQEQGDDINSYTALNNIIPIHPDFKLFVLANRPGMPFLGNNFFRECGDLFTTLVIENPDIKSEVRLLMASAPTADSKVMTRLAKAFADLRKHHEDGVLSYPFSAREAVAVTSIWSIFHYGMNEALDNILDFETLNVTHREFIADVFRKHGFEVDAGITKVIRISRC